MEGASLPVLPLEIQLEVLQHLYYVSPSSFASAALVLSRAHHRHLVTLLYRHICVRNRAALEGLASTLIARPELAACVRSFFFQGPQGRKRTGRELLLAWEQSGEEDQASTSDEEEEQEPEAVYDENGWCEARGELEPGIEGEGQEATWDEHESLMHLCTLILRICAANVVSCGFVDCVPWFLAPYEGGNLNFPLPRCRDFTGVTVGLFGLLPHLQREKQRVEGSDTSHEEDKVTSLRRIHLIGGDFGSFALQRVLVAAPTAKTLTHLHITAPTLYRVEHHSHLVSHITQLLQSNARLERISVAFLRWHRPPPRRKATRSGNGSQDKTLDELERRMRELSSETASSSATVSSPTTTTATEQATGEDSYERMQLRGVSRSRKSQRDRRPASVERSQRQSEDERVQLCREAYVYALPQALEASQRFDVEASIVELPFVEGSPVGFAGWILTQGQSEAAAAQLGRFQAGPDKQRLPRLAGPAKVEKSWRKRDLSLLPVNVADDGAPVGSIWAQEASLVWKLNRDGDAQLIKGSL